jgi:hypothetical protein
LRVAAHEAGVDRLVVLVDQDHDLLAVVAVELAGEVGERPVVELARGGVVEDAAEAGGFQLAQGGSVEQIPVLIEEVLDLEADLVPRLLEGRGLHVLEGEREHRVPPEMLAVARRRRPRSRVPRRGARGPRRPLQETTEHREVERLAEPPRPGQEDHRGGVVEDAGDERRLVDVNEALLAEAAKIGEADGVAGRHDEARRGCGCSQG